MEHTQVEMSGRDFLSSRNSLGRLRDPRIIFRAVTSDKDSGSHPEKSVLRSGHYTLQRLGRSAAALHKSMDDELPGLVSRVCIVEIQNGCSGSALTLLSVAVG